MRKALFIVTIGMFIFMHGYYEPMTVQQEMVDQTSTDEDYSDAKKIIAYFSASKQHVIDSSSYTVWLSEKSELEDNKQSCITQ